MIIRPLYLRMEEHQSWSTGAGGRNESEEEFITRAWIQPRVKNVPAQHMSYLDLLH
jgi:hypothetical protein